MSGIILIDKPEGLRSTQCVNIIKRNFKGLKVGHAGTLDSTASGLLVVLVGKATKLSEKIMSMEKVYRVKIEFGSETDSCDYSGEILKSYNCDSLTQTMINDALFNFLGWRMQRPPEISAIKIHGKAAHKLARSGEKIEISERPVFIKSIKTLSELHENILELEITCSKGTYVRSIARDLGRFLNVGGFVRSLRRLSIGKFSVDKAISPDSDSDLILENVNYNWSF